MSSPNDKVPGVALTPADNGGVNSLAAFRDDLTARMFTSLDISSDEGKATLLMALQGENASLGDMIGEEIEISHLVVHNVEVLDEDTGELLERDRIVIVQPDGTMLSAVSQGIRKSVQLLCALYRLPPYDPPLRVKIVQTNTKRGRRLYQLLPVAKVVKSESAGTGRRK